MNDTEYTCDIFGVRIIPTQAYFFPLAIILSAQCISAIFFNSLFLLAMSKQVCKTSVSEHLFMMLAVTDMLAALAVMPGWVVQIVEILFAKLHCFLPTYLLTAGYSLVLMSVTIIVLITVDIYLSILHPFLYQKFATKSRATFVAILMWSLCMASSLTSSIVSSRCWQRYEVIGALLTIPVVISMFLIHFRVYKEVEKIQKKGSVNKLKKRKKIGVHKRSLRMAVGILITFVLCFIPLAVYSIYVLIMGKTAELVTYGMSTVYTITLLNCVLDPFVYYFRLTKVRRRVSSILSSRQSNHSLAA